MKAVKQKLSSACCALLGISQTVIADSEPWVIDLGVMNYIEQDRNTGIELIGKGTRNLLNGGQLELAAEIDVITGATPNGASSSNVQQTFTQASGVGNYTTDADELPADDTHMDTRLSLKADVKAPATDLFRLDYNGLISMEFDYLAFAVGANVAMDFNKRNNTILAGFNKEYNRVHPVGNTPKPLAIMQPSGQFQPRGVSSKTKTGDEFSLGLIQIIDTSSLVQLRFTTSHFSGYLTDPYKLVSVVDDQNLITPGATQHYIFESRPDSRNMNSLYLAYKKSFETGILDLSMRWYEDSWDIKSQTVDMAFKYRLADQYFIRPNLRLYHQNEASFYRHSLTGSEPTASYVSADIRLAEFDALTLGLEFGKDLPFSRKHSITVEYYTQRGDSSPDDAVGLQQQQDLYPTLQTLIVKYVYSLKW